MKEAWAHLQNQLFEEKNIQQENIRKEEKEEQKRIANAVNVMFKKLNTIMENL